MQTGIGDALRAARRAQGHTLTDAAAATRVRETYLAALEEEDFGALGGEVYARGFLRSYARYLSLDPEPLLEAFRERGQVQEQPRGRGRAARRPARPAGAAPALRPERPAGAAVLLLLLVVVLVVIAFVGLWDGQAEGFAARPPAGGRL